MKDRDITSRPVTLRLETDGLERFPVLWVKSSDDTPNLRYCLHSHTALVSSDVDLTRTTWVFGRPEVERGVVWGRREGSYM